ncbi:ABC transporter transmembrane domain-containing protein [Mangrovicoccus ximenensis]|uniref:ABC transporter transmembrane domain-containing protein n=1 Tax=Mangrovicoccus ximenensis TaxID=1911570 RepID=UPI000D370BC0|nr:ABC transporter transmembrane domain-containing protein [Mangrovicoccus ximenensis]
MERSKEQGLKELRAARAESNGLFAFVGIFSVFVNLLMLTGPLFMLQVYDRVLGSRSEATLVALAALVAFLYLMMGILDYVRGRVLARIGARFQAKLDRRVFAAALEDAATKDRGAAAAGVRDLETVQRFLASPILGSLFDLPFTPVFVAGIFFFHPWLGVMALGGGAILVFLTFLNQRSTKAPQLAASQAAATADMMSERRKAMPAWSRRWGCAAPPSPAGSRSAASLWACRCAPPMRPAASPPRPRPSGCSCNRRCSASAPIWCCRWK